MSEFGKPAGCGHALTCLPRVSELTLPAHPPGERSRPNTTRRLGDLNGLSIESLIDLPEF